MVGYQEEICEMVPETYQMLQSDNAFDDVELQDPLVVIKGDVIVLRVYAGEVVDGNNMWILHMPDDISSPYYNLRHQLSKKHQEEAVMEKNQSSSAKGSTFIVCEDTQPAIVCADIQPDIVCEDIQPAIECREVVCEDSQPAIECQEADNWGLAAKSSETGRFFGR